MPAPPHRSKGPGGTPKPNGLRGWLLPLGLALGILASAALAAACSDGGPAGGPRLVLDGDSFDLGQIGENETTQRSLVFRNEGQEPLKVSIVKVRPAPDAQCGCGVEDYQVRPATVPPGVSGELVFSLRAPEGMAGMQDKMLVELESNDPSDPQRTITLIFSMAP